MVVSEFARFSYLGFRILVLFFLGDRGWSAIYVYWVVDVVVVVVRIELSVSERGREIN